MADFSTTCKTFEVVQRSRLNRPVSHRLIHVPASFSCTAADAPDMRSMVREVVREDFRVVLPEYYHPFFNARTPDMSLK